MAILAVFCAGLVKLWWDNRLAKKQEAADAEKRARMDEMRRMGLSVKRANDIPFGIRAIQSGIEVDGIWISRPESLNDAAAGKFASSSSLSGRDTDSQRKGRGSPDDDRTLPTGTKTSLERASAKQSPSNGPLHQRPADSESVASAQSVTLPAMQFTSKANRPPKHPLHETYIPTTPRQNLPQPSQRSSVSLSGESVASQPRSAGIGSASVKNYTPSSHSPRLYHTAPRSSPGNRVAGQDAVATGAVQRWPDWEGGGRGGDTPFGAGPGQAPSPRAHQDMHAHVQQGPPPAPPEPTFGPGDLHFSNRATRRVNSGFEVLPAGSLSAPRGVDMT